MIMAQSWLWGSEVAVKKKMRFFPHAVKQPLLGTESKRKRREKEEV